MKDKLSALLDGDLDDQSATAVLEAVRRTPVLRTDWDAYCLIGDTLRGDAGGKPIVARVMDALRDEPALLVPSAAASARVSRSFRQAVMPVAASVMGVAVVGAVAYTLYPQAPTASAPVPSLVATQDLPAAPPRQSATAALAGSDDPHRKYVVVHQAMSGGGPISGAVQYVRSVSDVRGEVR